jgi:ABC-type maltose transport system permease subunit
MLTLADLHKPISLSESGQWLELASVAARRAEQRVALPWTLSLTAYQGQYSTSWQLVLAFITLTTLPTILMFLLAQRYIVASLTAGAVKGRCGCSDFAEVRAAPTP